MELWQMDIVGGVRLVDGSGVKILSGIDDHSRFVISAQVVARATARPTCEALALALRRYGVPEQILTDNGKVFTGRFGPGTGAVLFDRICRENGIKHLRTAPRPPTTDRKSAVAGTRVSVRVLHCGRRIIKTNHINSIKVPKRHKTH